MMRIFLGVALTISLLTVGAFFTLSYLTKQAHGPNVVAQKFEVRQGENMFDTGKRLEEAGLIVWRPAFLWHLAYEQKTRDLVAGTYSLSGTFTIAEIARMITTGQTVSRDIKITFPEGWSARKMAERLTANNLPGEQFLVLVRQPKEEWRTHFDFFSDVPKGTSLEGFLFPDTYFFDPNVSAEAIVEKMLSNFDKKFDTSLRAALKERRTNIYSAVTLASIVENEVKSENDRKIVADIFLRRLSIGQALQSCATLQYILGVDRAQYSYEETQTVSPYNTYLHRGLPPGPIGNPSIISLRAALFPKSNSYFYFLSDPETGKTIFSVTYEEHLKNKNLYGL
ncbi:MAG: endolytic transglycosylase MltG [Candidatus Moranbacteria bacterium]|nr:endolytic transglycosylase MltG [Candidatus Moranbacteria bacterium]